MKYKFTMHSGDTTTLAIIENIKFEDGVLKATKVGEFDGFDLDTNEQVFKECLKREFIAGGGPYTLEEYFG